MLRRTEAYNIKSNKPVYVNDSILVSEKLDSNCGPKKTETKEIKFQIPQTIFINDEEASKIKIPLNEKQLQQGPSSSLSGKLYKVKYVL